MPHPKGVIVAEHASERVGGEAILPLHWFRMLRERGVEAWLVVHARTEAELRESLPGELLERITFVPDTGFQSLWWKLGRKLPARIRSMLISFPIHIITQRRQRRVVRRLVREHGVDVVHEPIPVSPKAPSLMHGVGAPVVIGPMNGGMDFPPAYRHMEGRGVGMFVAAGRAVAGLLNRLMPGKRRAKLLLVANQRTADAMPFDGGGRVIELVENGVDLTRWHPAPMPWSEPEGEPESLRVLFLGRLDALKGVDHLLRALHRVRSEGVDARLQILGDGADRPRLESVARELGLSEGAENPAVRFLGFVPQSECPSHLAQCDLLALPSLRECGGAVVLEAMATARPVLAADWGGPADYIDASCGILVPPEEPEQFVQGLAEGLLRLAKDPALRRSMGEAGRKRVEQIFDWRRKTDRMLELYLSATGGE